jgi:hypothetical protein
MLEKARLPNPDPTQRMKMPEVEDQVSPVLSNRVGFFSVASPLIRENSRWFNTVFQNMVIVRAEMLFQSNEIVYTAFCDDFEALELGTAPKNYRAEITKSGDALNVTWKRVEKH